MILSHTGSLLLGSLSPVHLRCQRRSYSLLPLCLERLSQLPCQCSRQWRGHCIPNLPVSVVHVPAELEVVREALQEAMWEGGRVQMQVSSSNPSRCTTS